MDKRVIVLVNGVPIKRRFKNESSARAYVYELNRVYHNEYNDFVVVQSDRRIDRRNKQARRAFEMQEV